MPKLNPYLPKENYKKVEEISYLEEKETITPEEQAKVVDKLVKNEIPSYEEFMKTYQEDERVSDNYYYEIDSYGDIRVVKYYGPGFWDDFLRPVTSAALAISYAIPPVAAVTIPLSVGVGVTGAAMATLSDDSDARNVGCQMLGVVGEATVSHLSGDSADGANKTKLVVEHIRRNI